MAQEVKLESEQTRIIEVNGVKLEVDLRTAKRVDTLRIGDRVKCLVKQYNDYKVYPGIIAGFDPFEKLPTIVVAYLEAGYNPDIHFKSYNADTEDFEIVPDIDHTSGLVVDKGSILDRWQVQIDKKYHEAEELEDKRKFFLDNFGRYFEQVEV